MLPLKSNTYQMTYADTDICDWSILADNINNRLIYLSGSNSNQTSFVKHFTAFIVDQRAV